MGNDRIFLDSNMVNMTSGITYDTCSVTGITYDTCSVSRSYGYNGYNIDSRNFSIDGEELGSILHRLQYLEYLVNNLVGTDIKPQFNAVIDSIKDIQTRQDKIEKRLKVIEEHLNNGENKYSIEDLYKLFDD